MNDTIIADTPEKIQAFMLLRLKGALSLEIKGMKCRGHSAHHIIKTQYGLRGNKQAVFDQFCTMLKAMGILEPEKGGLVGWLTNTCNAFDVKPCTVQIGNQVWPAAVYAQEHEYQAGMDCVSRGEHKAGEKYQETGIYCVGALPECYHSGRKNNVCFPIDGKDWYIAGYGTEACMREPYSEYHPFGPNFILRLWQVPDGTKIDHYEVSPYKRVPLTLGSRS